MCLCVFVLAGPFASRLQLVNQTEDEVRGASALPSSAPALVSQSSLDAAAFSAKYHQAPPRTEAALPPPASTRGGGAGGAGGAGGGKAPEYEKTAEQKEQEALERLRSDLATGPGNQIVLVLSDALRSLVPLLSTAADADDESGLALTSNDLKPLVHDAVKHCFLQFTSLLLQDTLRLSEGYVHSVRSTLLSVSLSEGAAPVAPMFYVVLAQLCQFMVQRGVGNCLMFLQDSFPLDDDEEGEGLATTDRAEEDQHVILSDMKEAVQLLLRKYVEAQALSIAGQVFADFEAVPWRDVTTCSAVRPTLLAVGTRLDQVAAELRKMYPREDLAPAAAAPASQAPAKGGRDLSKLFTARVQIYGPVAGSRSAPLVAVHKIVFRALIEVPCMS